ncbi:uncharacterized protein LOC114332779 [Diabrotica virgifera virgifera]|uniref:Protein ALP1-like n=1 Tax=Diabrotica virgifera virgifera TaxID=50390 RepID=A0A6P7G147_DIAVI|nr:uncharacterized protein LOC114332779 [Diabrotica virgifera virgifera]
MFSRISKRKVAALVAILFMDEDDEKPVKKRKWCEQWSLDRDRNNSNVSLLKELEEKEPPDYDLRMDSDAYTSLLALLCDKITKRDTIMRKAISAEERLVATLRFLATGCSYEDLKFKTGISPQALSKIIPETCKAIYDALKTNYLKVPSTEAEWKEVSNGFQDHWQFTNCLGAIDGKHINMKKPGNSVVLLAIVNANYEFIYVHTGTNDQMTSDGGIWSQTKRVLAKNINIPSPTELPGTEDKVPYVFIGDEAFPLMENLLTPYSQKNPTYEEKVFNYRLCRARRVVENVFGVLASRFRIFQQPFNINLDKIELVILACCALHNFLRKTCKSNYITEKCIDREDINNGTVIPGEWRQQTGSSMTNLENTKITNASFFARNIRETYKNYFNNVGKVSFQDHMVK